MKKLLVIMSVLIVLVIIYVYAKNMNNTDAETKAICIENRFTILNKEMDLHLQLIGQKVTINDQSKHNKIVFVQLDDKNETYDFKYDFRSAMEYYSEKIDTSITLAGTKLFYVKRNDDSPILISIQERFKDKVIIATDSSNCFAHQFSLPPRGAIILLLNKNNICLYAYYLEQNNARKIFENSPVMFHLIENLK